MFTSWNPGLRDYLFWPFDGDWRNFLVNSRKKDWYVVVIRTQKFQKFCICERARLADPKITPAILKMTRINIYKFGYFTANFELKNKPSTRKLFKTILEKKYEVHTRLYPCLYFSILAVTSWTQEQILRNHICLLLAATNEEKSRSNPFYPNEPKKQFFCQNCTFDMLQICMFPFSFDFLYPEVNVFKIFVPL